LAFSALVGAHLTFGQLVSSTSLHDKQPMKTL